MKQTTIIPLYIVTSVYEIFFFYLYFTCILPAVYLYSTYIDSTCILPVYFAIVELFPVPVDPTQIIQLPILSSSSALFGADTGITTFPEICLNIKKYISLTYYPLSYNYNQQKNLLCWKIIVYKILLYFLIKNFFFIFSSFNYLR